MLGGSGLGRAAPPPASTLPGFGRAKSVLVVFTSGGQSQLDTWDPKPDAPAEVRGAFGTIPTSVPGVRVCEHMPRLAALHHRVTVLRSMTHDDLDHGSACYLALTGQSHPRKSSNPQPTGDRLPRRSGPSSHRVRPDRRFPHSAFHVNGPLLTPSEPGPGQYGGVLGRGYDPLELGDVTDGTALLTGMTLPRPARRTARRAVRSGAPARRRNARRRPTAGHRRPAGSGAAGLRAVAHAAGARRLRPRAGAREGPRPVRPVPGGAGVPDGAAPDRGRGAVGHGVLQPQHPRAGLPRRRDRPLRLGHPQRHLRGHAGPPAAAVRPRLLGTARRLARARTADGHPCCVHGRVRPGTAGGEREEFRRARFAGSEALGRVLLGGAGRGGRHAGCELRPVRQAGGVPARRPGHARRPVGDAVPCPRHPRRHPLRRLHRPPVADRDGHPGDEAVRAEQLRHRVPVTTRDGRPVKSS